MSLAIEALLNIADTAITTTANITEVSLQPREDGFFITLPLVYIACLVILIFVKRIKLKRLMIVFQVFKLKVAKKIQWIDYLVIKCKSRHQNALLDAIFAVQLYSQKP